MQWLPEGHLAYLILDVVYELDVSIEDAISPVVRSTIRRRRSGGGLQHSVLEGAGRPHKTPSRRSPS